MGRRTRECYLCGEKYSYCPTCSQDKTKPTWMAEFHEVNCKTIFQTCTDFNMKLLTKDEAKKVLSDCNLSNKESFRSSVQKTLGAIFAEDKKPAVEKTAKAPVAPKAAKTPVVEKTEAASIIEKTETIPAPEKAKIEHEVVTETEEK